MSLGKYLAHYFSMPDLLYMIGISLFIVGVIHLFIFLVVKAAGGDYGVSLEKYYEMIISSTSMLFFIGIYFLIEHNYFNAGEEFNEVWSKYDDFILLFFLFISIFFINFVDRFIIPLRLLYREEKATLRMMSMIYMLFVFAYIKFIYGNNNYDSIIAYFIIMVVGRFIYFDASFAEFIENMRRLFHEIPMLLLGLATTGILALYGFRSGYLLTANGVVLSLWIAQILVVVEISIINLVINASRG